MQDKYAATNGNDWIQTSRMDNKASTVAGSVFTGRLIRSPRVIAKSCRGNMLPGDTPCALCLGREGFICISAEHNAVQLTFSF